MYEFEGFFEAEFEWINRLSDEDPWLGPAWEYPDGYPIPEDWAQWCEHYKSLSPKEQALCGYALAVTGKDFFAQDYLNPWPPQPVQSVALNEVNNGYGAMYAINRDCFVDERPKLFYVRSEMRIDPGKDPAQIPEWITRMADEIREYSSGFSGFNIEGMKFSFDNEEPHDYYAFTFRFSPYSVREGIVMADMQWRTADIGEYIITLADITGEYDYCIGELTESGPIRLWYSSMDFH